MISRLDLVTAEPSKSEQARARFEAAVARDQLHIEGEMEPEPGLPAELPAGEEVLWSGAPDWRILAVHVFHVRLIAAATVLFTVLSATAALAQGVRPAILALAVLTPVLAGAAACGLATLSAWLVSWVSRYVVTNERVVLRVGLLLPVHLNLPFGEISDVSLRRYGKGAGDLPLVIRSHRRVSYLLLWPHVRPLTLGRVQPMLRAIRDVDAAASVLVDALRLAHARRPLTEVARGASNPRPMPEAVEAFAPGVLVAAE